MDGRGGCCIARYAGGGGGAAYDTSKMDRILMRFRPIAPKPAASGGSKASEGGDSDNRHVKTGRGRRRSYNNGSRKSYRKRKSSSPEESREKLPDKGGVHDNTVVTLSLLPETPDLTAATTPQGQKLPVWLTFDGLVDGDKRSKAEVERYGCVAVKDGQVGLLTRVSRAVVFSSVTVEFVTDAWAEEAGLGRTDEEKQKALEEDACPGFISDGWNRVWWTNSAFRKMAWKTVSFEAGEEDEMDVSVTLVMREKVPVTCQAYTCRVRVQSTWNGRDNYSPCSSTVTLPCDVWRMSGGGFAWRLDVEAALSLGR